MEKRVLIVDDSRSARKILASICEQLGCKTVEATNGREALEQVRDHQPDLILMDAVMPEMDGFEATRILKSGSATKHIPLIIVTTLSSREHRLRGISLGANDYVTKSFDREETMLRIRNMLKIKEYHDFLQDHNSILQRRVVERTADLKDAIDKLSGTNEMLRSAYIDTIYRLTFMSEYRDEDTASHIKRIGFFSSVLAETLGMERCYVETVRHASMMHDIGKVAIPDSIMLKTAALTNEERVIMQNHTTIGARILRGARSDYLKLAADIALTHHERWDGSGYPRGLKGEEIPICGRITHLADIYDALRSKRPYKSELDHEPVLKIMEEGDSRIQQHHFCPEVYDAFVRSADTLRDIYTQYQEPPEELTPVD